MSNMNSEYEATLSAVLRLTAPKGKPITESKATPAPSVHPVSSPNAMITVDRSGGGRSRFSDSEVHELLVALENRDSVIARLDTTVAREKAHHQQRANQFTSEIRSQAQGAGETIATLNAQVESLTLAMARSHVAEEAADQISKSSESFLRALSEQSAASLRNVTACADAARNATSQQTDRAIQYLQEVGTNIRTEVHHRNVTEEARQILSLAEQDHERHFALAKERVAQLVTQSARAQYRTHTLPSSIDKIIAKSVGDTFAASIGAEMHDMIDEMLSEEVHKRLDSEAVAALNQAKKVVDDQRLAAEKVARVRATGGTLLQLKTNEGRLLGVMDKLHTTQEAQINQHGQEVSEFEKKIAILTTDVGRQRQTSAALHAEMTAVNLAARYQTSPTAPVVEETALPQPSPRMISPVPTPRTNIKMPPAIAASLDSGMQPRTGRVVAFSDAPVTPPAVKLLGSTAVKSSGETPPAESPRTTKGRSASPASSVARRPLPMVGPTTVEELPMSDLKRLGLTGMKTGQPVFVGSSVLKRSAARVPTTPGRDRKASPTDKYSAAEKAVLYELRSLRAPGP